jgi:hypothetical protein
MQNNERKNHTVKEALFGVYQPIQSSLEFFKRNIVMFAYSNGLCKLHLESLKSFVNHSHILGTQTPILGTQLRHVLTQLRHILTQSHIRCTQDIEFSLLVEHNFGLIVNRHGNNVQNK